MRLASVLLALSRLGEIDLFTFFSADRTDLDPPPDTVRLRRVETVPRQPRPFGLLHRAAWMIAGRTPRALLAFDAGDAGRRLAAWSGERYALAWFHRAEPYVVLAPLLDAPTIVDLDDLEDEKLRSRLAPAALGRPADGRPWTRLQDRRDQRLWRALERTVAARVRRVVVCSEADQRRLDVANCTVIPNGYAPPERPLGRLPVGQPPVVLFAGLLSYPPNRDAAVLLVRDIAPRLRASLPGVQIRLVGPGSEAVRRLDDPPRVTVTGFVGDLTEELTRADVVAVPLLYGGGTRIKILEAFAHRIPVVSTTVGAAGLEVTPGQELLIGDTPDAFARGCVLLLTDPGRRAALADAAQQLYRRRYRADLIHDLIVALAGEHARLGVPA
jgi:glycosyltransferase involved in cell wall biosynthesis